MSSPSTNPSPAIGSQNFAQPSKMPVPPVIPGVMIVVVVHFLLAIAAALLTLLIPDPPATKYQPGDMKIDEAVGELKITVRIRPPLQRWRTVLLPATLLVTIPLRFISYVGTDRILALVFPRLIPVAAIWAILYLWGKTGSEVLTLGGGRLAVSLTWLGGRRIWRREVDSTRISAVRYELEIGPSLLGATRAIAIRRKDGRKLRFGNGLAPSQAQEAIREIVSHAGSVISQG